MKTFHNKKIKKGAVGPLENDFEFGGGYNYGVFAKIWNEKI